MDNRKYFRVVSKMQTVSGLNHTTTFHFNVHRDGRHNKIVETIGEGKCVAYFIVDKAHPNGNEIHCVYDNGIIVIYNERTKRLITELIARPAQIYRYWDGLNLEFPREYDSIISKARDHQSKGFNDW